MTYLKNFINDEEGQDLVEYALLLGFVAMAAAGILLTIGGDITSIFSKAKAQTGAAAAAA